MRSRCSRWCSRWGPCRWPELPSRSAGIGLLLALGLLLPVGASAQNLLTNPDFSNALQKSGWMESGTWATDDWEGNPGSGSLLITNALAGSAVLLARQCVAIQPGGTYDLAGRVRALPGQFTGTTTAAISVVWWTVPTCYTGSSRGTQAAFAPLSNAWEPVGSAGLQAPGDAMGADVRLQVFKSAGAGSFAASFDSISLTVPEPAAGAGALAALAALARRRNGRPRA